MVLLETGLSCSTLASPDIPIEAEVAKLGSVKFRQKKKLSSIPVKLNIYIYIYNYQIFGSG